MFEVPSIANACAYGDGKVALFLCDMSALYTGGASLDDLFASLALYDPETGTLGTEWPVTTDSQMGVYNLSGFCSDGQKVYYMDGSRIMGIDPETGESKIAAYTGEGMYGGSSYGNVLCEGGYYITASSGLNQYLLNSPSLEKGALRIFGESGSDTHRNFAKAHPEISVEVAGDYSNDLETLTQAMVSDTNPYDVLFLSLNYMPVDRLLQKGYCADLSGDEALMDVARSMYPQFGEILMKDGKLYGTPAVIDKDFASAKLAELLDADMLVILTAVEKVAINFGKPDQKGLDDLTPADARKYIEEKQFAPGSMLPKVQAALSFAESKPGRVALITLLEKAADGISGKTGTRVHQ